ncbi:Protein of unknown function [Amycolatopsis marina]|uniref:DUF3024 domain-containing protein n=1 Tax=Amycolatopsis marina TaxID=490629 RepID=A0A1I0W6V5_9PSEU|nr:DUF3024 domain-containing protein [Amycolatopsis marina]SFA84509.1 Protein of unknown function [Amycolatopsis marina]
MSPVPEFALRQVERWCAQKVPERMRDEIRVECKRRGRSLTIVERRAPSPLLGSDWTEQKVAQLRLGEDDVWSVMWADRNGRWRSYPEAPRAAQPVPLLEEIDSNPHGVFWG